MEYQGYLSQEDHSSTNFKHGEITNFPFGLSPSERAEFKLFLAKKENAEVPAAATVLIDCQLLLDETASPLPVNPEKWTDRMVYLPDSLDNQALLANYRIFWRGGPTSPIV